MPSILVHRSLFYEILGMAQKGITEDDSLPLDLEEKARSLFEACRVTL